MHEKERKTLSLGLVMYCIGVVNIFSAIGLSCDRELGRLL
jgi:hypothetical protein